MTEVFNSGLGGCVCDQCRKLLYSGNYYNRNYIYETSPDTIVEMYPNMQFCSTKCRDQYMHGWTIKAAAHFIHQKYGTGNPLSKIIQGTKNELLTARKRISILEQALTKIQSIQDKRTYRNQDLLIQRILDKTIK